MFDPEPLRPLRAELEAHPVYHSICSLEDLRCFMEHHVFLVWDFMSLLKSLQQTVTPSVVPWLPAGNPQLRRFVNEIVLAEESDEGLPQTDGQRAYASHFELYLQAMREVSAQTEQVMRFLKLVQERGVDAALGSGSLPAPCAEFMRTTFGFIATGKPHVVAAAFAIGREKIIPDMFRALLRRMGTTAQEAPIFHYYLSRHLELDEESHGPMAMLLLDELCAGDTVKLSEAHSAAAAAVKARIHFWDGVRMAICASSAHQR
jgi:hypothetical protein